MRKIINPSYIILSLIKMLVSSAYPFVNIIIPKLIIDELLGGRSIYTLALYVALIVGLNLVYKVFTSFMEAKLQKQASAISLRHDYMISEITMALPYEHLERDAMIQLVKRAKEGKERSGGVTALINCVFSMMSNIITTIGLVALIASLDLSLILIAAVTILVNTWVQSKLKKHDMEFFNVLMQHNTKFMYLSGVILNRRYAKDIRLYEANRTFTSKMDAFAMDVDAWFKKTGRKKVKHSMLSSGVDCVSQAVIYGYLAVQFLGGFITIGLFTMYINAVTAFTNVIVEIMKTVLDIYEKYKWLKPSFEFMQYKNDRGTIHGQSIQSGGVKPNIVKPVIEFRNVSYKYENSDVYALKNVSMTIPYGQRLSVVGMNGAGKTTLIKLLLRLYTPTGGAIYIGGININEYPIEEYYKLFSVVFQDFKLLAATVRENITCAQWSGGGDKELAECLAKSGLDGRVSKMPLGDETQLYKLFDPSGVDLSGGEEQRLAISRALYKNAPVVILDEPTSALDPKTEYEIYTSMDKLVENRTSIYISHRMTSCIFCDMVAVFHEGELIQYGNHKELIGQYNMYAQMFNTQAQYYA